MFTALIVKPYYRVIQQMRYPKRHAFHSAQRQHVAASRPTVDTGDLTQPNPNPRPTVLTNQVGGG